MLSAADFENRLKNTHHLIIIHMYNDSMEVLVFVRLAFLHTYVFIYTADSFF